MELPKKIQEHYDEVYDKANDKYGEDRAQKIASLLIDKNYTQTDKGWVGKTKLEGTIINKNQTILKTNGGRSTQHFVEGYLTNSNIDGHNMRFSQTVIKAFEKQLSNSFISVKGGIEHDTNISSRKYNPNADFVGRIVHANADNNGLFIKVLLNQNSSRYKKLSEDLKSGFIDGFSIEALHDPSNDIQIRVLNGLKVREVINARIDGFTFTGDGDNRSAKITADYIQ